MKKFMTIALAAALMFAVVGKASATALETSGEFRARGWYLSNYFQSGKNTEFWDQRLRLYMTWPISETVKVQVRADVLEGFWGDNAQTTTRKVVETSSGPQLQEETTGVPGKDPVHFDWANLTFAWPGTPLTVAVGRMDSSWGTGLWTMASNRDRLKVSANLDPVTLVAGYDKRAEVEVPFAPKGDDARDFFVLAKATAGGFNVGGGVLYYLDQRKIAYADDRKFFVGDLYAMGKAAIVDLKGEVVYITGKSGKVVDGNQQDGTGVGAYLGAFVPAGPVKLGLEGVYVSGDKPDTADKDEGMFKSDYQGPFWSVIFYQNMDYPGYLGSTQTSDYSSDRQVYNALAFKASAVATPIKGLTVIANVLYAQADQVAAGQDKPMGEEIDLVLVYGVTDNVSVTAGAGYAILGDYWKGQGGAAAGSKPDNPLGTVLAFTAKF